MIQLEILKQLPLLNGVDEERLLQLAQVMRVTEYQRHEFVMHKGAQGDDLAFLIKGRLQIVNITEFGKEIGLHFLSSGDYFGELSVIDDQPRSASIVATSKSVVAFLPKNAALHLIHHYPIVTDRILKRLAGIIRRDIYFRSLMGTHSAFQRIYALLLNYAQTHHRLNFVTIENPPTQQELAIMANTSRETVSRAISELVQRGVVEKDINRLIIRNLEQLKLLVSTGRRD